MVQDIVRVEEKVKRLYYAYPLDIVQGASTESEQNIKISEAADFIVTHITSVQTSASCQFILRDSISNQQWSYDYLNQANIAGTASNPFPLPKKSYKFLKRGCILYYRVKDTSGSSNTIQLCLHGYEKFYNLEKVTEPDSERREFFSYPVDTALSALGTASVQVKIPSSYDFLITHITGTQTGAYTVQARDSGLNRNWFDVAIRNGNLVGTAQFPFYLPKTKFVRAGSTITFDFTDLLNSGTNTIQINLHGYQIPA